MIGKGEDAVEETVAVALDHFGDAAHVGDVGTDAQNHSAPRALPRSIAARIAGVAKLSDVITTG